MLTKSACAKAEELLAPLGPAAKEYKLILAGHAHIDMNWMWSWHETVAATLATFRTMLNIMDEYPEFCLDVYKRQIVAESIGNILFSADETLNVQRAQKRLEDERVRLWHKNKRGGRIYELECEREELLERRKAASADYAAIISKEGQLYANRATR